MFSIEAYKQIDIASRNEWSETNSLLSATFVRSTKHISKINLFWRNWGHMIIVFLVFFLTSTQNSPYSTLFLDYFTLPAKCTYKYNCINIKLNDAYNFLHFNICCYTYAQLCWIFSNFIKCKKHRHAFLCLKKKDSWWPERWYMVKTICYTYPFLSKNETSSMRLCFLENKSELSPMIPQQCGCLNKMWAKTVPMIMISWELKIPLLVKELCVTKYWCKKENSLVWEWAP